MEPAAGADGSKIVPQFVFAVAAIAVGAAVVWWNSRAGETPSEPPSTGSTAAPAAGAEESAPDTPAEPLPVAFDLLDDWRFPGAGDQLESAGLQRPGYFSETPPPVIAALDGRRITIDGFVLPVELDDAGRITSCMLLRHQLGCGYGKAPTPSQRISVTLAPGARIDLRSGQAANAVGVLTVNEKPSGAFPALYSMTVESLIFTTGYNPDASETASEAAGESGGAGG